jgi:hypothetical protein
MSFLRKCRKSEICCGKMSVKDFVNNKYKKECMEIWFHISHMRNFVHSSDTTVYIIREDYSYLRCLRHEMLLEYYDLKRKLNLPNLEELD